MQKYNYAYPTKKLMNFVRASIGYWMILQQTVAGGRCILRDRIIALYSGDMSRSISRTDRTVDNTCRIYVHSVRSIIYAITSVREKGC